MSEPLPPVTVIICTYRRAEDLRKCLESVRGQDYPAFETLVVFRPSEDDTEKVAASFRARVVRQESKGIANARNLGVRAATTDIIAFIDDDCTAEKDWLRKLVGALLAADASGASGVAITAGTGRVEFANGTVDIYGKAECRNAAPGRYYAPDGRVFNNIVCMNVAFRRQAVLAVGGFDEYFNNFYEETDLCVRMIQAGYRVVHAPEAVVCHGSAAGPNRKSRWDQNWYVISRNSTYMPFKNFRRGRLRRAATLTYLYVKRMVSFLVPFVGGEITFRQMLEIDREITRGFLDGVRDAKSTARPRAGEPERV